MTCVGSGESKWYLMSIKGHLPYSSNCGTSPKRLFGQKCVGKSSWASIVFSVDLVTTILQLSNKAAWIANTYMKCWRGSFSKHTYWCLNLFYGISCSLGCSTSCHTTIEVMKASVPPCMMSWEDRQDCGIKCNILL